MLMWKATHHVLILIKSKPEMQRNLMRKHKIQNTQRIIVIYLSVAKIIFYYVE